jgi:hypothetical protein
MEHIDYETVYKKLDHGNGQKHSGEYECKREDKSEGTAQPPQEVASKKQSGCKLEAAC